MVVHRTVESFRKHTVTTRIKQRIWLKNHNRYLFKPLIKYNGAERNPLIPSLPSYRHIIIEKMDFADKNKKEISEIFITYICNCLSKLDIKIKKSSRSNVRKCWYSLFLNLLEGQWKLYFPIVWIKKIYYDECCHLKHCINEEKSDREKAIMFFNFC